MPKKSRLRGPFDKQHSKRAQALFKSHPPVSYLLIIANSFELEKSLLLTCKILGLLGNTLAADGKYLVPHRDNLTTPIQMQLSVKRNTFSQLFAAFLKFILNFKHFEKKDETHSFCISEITDSENVVK